jgi:uncharacterized SAM-binding protein YcdF (DUF218 family)
MELNKLLGRKCLLIIGIISLLYFFLITVYVGYLNIYNCIWVFIGIALIVLHKQVERIRKLYKNLSNIIKKMLLVFVMVCTLSFVIIEGSIIAHSRNRNSENAHCFILLGAGLNGSSPSLTLLRRINTAVKQLEQNNKAKIVVSGGKGNHETSTEAEVMSNILQNRGIAAERIIMEDQSTSTCENLLYSGKLIDIDKKIVIVSSGFHLFRAKCIAKKLGYKNIGGIGSRSPVLLLPNYYVREYFAVIKELIAGNI